MKTAALYARVSSEQQKEKQTIGSQTSALLEYAQSHGYMVPREWVFQDEGYSGARLDRPGLERLRDLSAEGQVEAILVYAPDRLSRKYAYQILLLEEFSRNGTEVIFLQSAPGEGAEANLLSQFQGIIAEYERAQIKERSRRGKRYRAKKGVVNVLSAAPYGYDYVAKTDVSDAYYRINEAEAAVVREIFRLYTEEGYSIGGIVRHLTATGIPTRHGKKWERSTIWAILQNSAYRGLAYFGKTEVCERQRVTRPLRQKGGFSKCCAHRDRPKDEWIAIPVPGIVDAETFELAEALLEKNKQFAKRRTIVPSLLQGLLVCEQCGYSLYRASTRTSKRKIYYYRCLGSDRWRWGEKKCSAKPLRQDYLDEVVWDHVVQLLQQPELIDREINQRLGERLQSNEVARRKECLEKELARIQKAVDKLLDAYQEGLVSLEQLRQRMPELRTRENARKREHENLQAQVIADMRLDELKNTVQCFLQRLEQSAKKMDIQDKQKLLRLVVKEIVVGEESVTIKHGIPLSGRASAGKDPPSYLLRSGGDH